MTPTSSISGRARAVRIGDEKAQGIPKKRQVKRVPGFWFDIASAHTGRLKDWGGSKTPRIRGHTDE